MPLISHLDDMLAKRKMTLDELAQRARLPKIRVRRIKQGEVDSIKLESLAAICDVLDCQPSDLLEYIPSEK